MASAPEIVRLLEARHCKDTFVAECKTGPTWHSRGLRRLDGWALLPTWSPPTTVGYEIKVSRSDWLNDTKFGSYLEQCHVFYIVALKGVVQLGELPDSVGYLEVAGSGAGARLLTKRKAVRREIPWPGELMAYVLMSRVTVKAGMYDRPEPTRADRVEQWRARIAVDAEANEIGRQARKCVREHIDRVERERAAALARVERVEMVEQEIKALGITSLSAWGVREHLRRHAVMSELDEVIAKLQAIRAKGDSAALEVPR